MDMLKANPSSHRHVLSGSGPGEGVNHHLLCIPLALEQAVCLSSSWSGTTFAHGPQIHARRSEEASHCIHDADPEKSDVSSIHLRNILICLRHALLEWNLADAAKYVAVLVSQRAIVPDVVFKAGLAVLASAPIRDSDARLTRFLREIASASNPPRTAPMYLELVRRHLLANQHLDARRELIDRLALGRPYDRSAEYLHCLGLTNFLSVLCEVGSQYSINGRESEAHVDDDSGLCSNGLETGGPGACLPPSLDRLRVTSAQSRESAPVPATDQGPAGAGAEDISASGLADRARANIAEDGTGVECLGAESFECLGRGSGGMADWCAFGRGVQQARAFRGHEAYGEARSRLLRALELERSDASAHLLARLLCMGGDFDAAVRAAAGACASHNPGREAPRSAEQRRDDLAPTAMIWLRAPRAHQPLVSTS